MAMEARCYRGGENRTRMNVLKYSRRDLYGLIFMCIYLSIIVTTRFF